MSKLISLFLKMRQNLHLPFKYICLACKELNANSTGQTSLTFPYKSFSLETNAEVTLNRQLIDLNACAIVKAAHRVTRFYLCGYPQVGTVAGAPPLLPLENNELASQLKRLESSFSIFAEESNPNQLLAHLGRMAVEFHHLSSKVQKNEQRTSLLQVCCQTSMVKENLCLKTVQDFYGM